MTTITVLFASLAFIVSFVSSSKQRTVNKISSHLFPGASLTDLGRNEIEVVFDDVYDVS